MTIQCNQFEQILEQQEDDGRLPKSALDRIDVCDACRALTADLDAIHGIASELGTEGIAPPEHVWISLRNQLEAEHIIRDSQTESGDNAQPAPLPVNRGWWIVFQRPALAGAFLSVILVAAAMVTYQGGASEVAVHPQFEPQQESSPVLSAEEEMLTVGSAAGRDSIPGMQNRDAAVTDSIRRNLGVVDKFIGMCEKSVREQPDNEMAREYLYGAYQQKAELLATAMNRNMPGGLQ